jgi:multidrug efflux system membrane fusion protein
MLRLFPLCVIVLLAATGCAKKNAAPSGGAPVPVIVGDVIRKDMPLELRVIGNVEPISTVGIKAQVGGELLKVNFEEGQEVKKGDLIFALQPKLYAVQLAQAQANLAKDRALAANARSEIERNTQLGAKGAISKEQLDLMRYTADSWDATVKADEALVEIAGVRLGYASIKSPLDGVTGALRVHAGDVIKDNADDPMVTINQLSPIYVTFAVAESHLANIRARQAQAPLAVIASDPATGQPLATGALSVIANSVDTTTGTIQLKATFANDDHALWPGAFVDVSLNLSIDAGATVAPASAVTTGQKGAQIYVVKADSSVELRTVTVNRVVGQEVIIEKGVEPGEKVVTVGQLRLAPGAKALVKPDDGPPAVDPNAPVIIGKPAASAQRAGRGLRLEVSESARA